MIYIFIKYYKYINIILKIMNNLIKIIIYNIIYICVIYSFKINIFDNVIGNWQLLYSSNIFLNDHKFKIDVIPCKNNINELLVKINRYETNNLITYSKIINCIIQNEECNELNNSDKCSLSIKDEELCTLVILKTEKYIKSIGIFEFPYFAVDYISGMNPKYLISWRVDNLLERLYIYFDNNTYVFKKKYYDIQDCNNERITTNVFLITNILSFYLGKFLEKILHIN